MANINHTLGVNHRSASTTLIDNQAIQVAYTSDSIYTRDFRYFVLYLNVDSTSDPTTIRFGIEFSDDNVTFYNVAKESTRFKLSGGEALSLERDVLGDGLQVRYFQLIINDMGEIPYKEGVFVASFTEFAVYTNLVLVGEAVLTPYTELAIASTTDATTITVDDTTGFSSSGTAYINDDSFTYTGKTDTTFTGCSGVVAHTIDARVSQETEREGASTILTSHVRIKKP